MKAYSFFLKIFKTNADFMLQKKYSFCLTFTFISLAFFTQGQIVNFENLGLSDGLSSSQVYCIEQDKYGFIWLGTGKGLNIFNGNDFKHYFAEPGNKNSLPGNRVEKIIFNGDTAFVGTRSGLCMMDVVTKKCNQIDIGSNNDIRTLLFEKDQGILWIGTQTGLIKYDIKSNNYRLFNETNSNISHNIVRAIYLDDEGFLWVGTFDKLNKLSPNSLVFEQVSLPETKNPNIENNLILSIEPFNDQSDSLLWIGMQTGLVLYNRVEKRTENFLGEKDGLINSVIKDIHNVSNNKTWLGTDLGLVEMLGAEINVIYIHDPYKRTSLANSRIWEVFEDYSSTMWFGTENGISILSNTTERFSFYPMVFDISGIRTGYDIRGIVEDRSGNIWMATQNGFIRYNPGTKLLQTYNSDISLLSDASSIFEDSKGRIWVATNGGLTLFNPITNVLRNYSVNLNNDGGLRTNYIKGFIESPNGLLLINTKEGLHKVEEINGQIGFQFIGNLEIKAACKNYLWALNDSSIVRVNPETFEMNDVFTNTRENLKQHFYSLMINESENIIWAGFDNGLLMFDISNEEYKVFEIQSNKNYPIINLLMDDEQNIWASSNSAIIKFSDETSEFEIYPSGNEILVSRFFRESSFKSSNGEIIFGGQDGFIRFSPQSIKKSDYKPALRLTRLIIAHNEINPYDKVNNKIVLQKDISFTDEIVLDYAVGSFVIEFSSMHFGSRNRIRYKYMLEGEDIDWTYVDNSRGRASYSRLMPGNYTLRVLGTNNDGVWSNQEVTLGIKIKPPIWANEVFIFLYVSVLVLIIILLVNYFHRRSQWRRQMEIIKLEVNHSETIAKSRQRFFTNIAHEFLTPLNLIVGPTEKLLGNKTLDAEARSLTELIESNARRLLWLNNQFLDLRKVENMTIQMDISEFEIVGFLQSIFLLYKDQAKNRNIKYDFNTDVDSLMVQMDLRKLETIVFNLLSNAFKNTEENGEIQLSISKIDSNDEEKVVLSVKDSGIGISINEQTKIFERFYQSNNNKSKKRGLGIGLNLVKAYVEIHKGEISLVSEQGKGSEFIVSIPLIENQQTMFETGNLDDIKPLLKTLPGTDFFSPVTRISSVNQYTLLVVSDDHELVDFLSMSLSKKYNVDAILIEIQAYRQITKKKPSLIIGDLNLTRTDGFELIKQLKSNPNTAHIPFIVISGHSEKENQLKALKLGADAYFKKPIEIEFLEQKIENFLKRSEQLSDYYKLDKLSNPTKVNVSSQNEKILEKVVSCIEENISDPELDINKVCKETGFSHTFLYRKIKNLTGQSLKYFIREVKLRRAEQLLRTKKLSVAEVMAETGFSNHSYFSKCFKSIYNKTPKEYINSL